MTVVTKLNDGGILFSEAVIDIAGFDSCTSLLWMRLKTHLSIVSLF